MKRNLINIIIQKTDKQIALSLFVSAFLLRAIYALVYYYTQPIPETNLYYELAQYIIAQGRVFYETSHPYYEFPGPILPWLNALTMLIFGKNYLGLYLVTALGSALITLYTYKTARLFLNKTVSLFAGVWSVFYLFYFYYTSSSGKDIWMAFFMIFLIYYFLLLFVEKQFRISRYILFIVMLVISFHLDERFFAFVPFIGLYIIYWETNGFRKFSIAKTALFAILLIVLMIPWTVRNYKEHNKIVILTTRTEHFTDPILGYELREHIIDDYNDIYGMYYIHEHQFDSVIAGKKTHTDMGRKIAPEMVKAMQRGELPKPLTGVRALGVRLLSMFEPLQLQGRYERSGYFYYKKSFRHNLATFVFYGILLLFSFPGFYYLYKRDKLIFYIFLSVIVIYGMIHALTIPYTNWRYRLPLDSIFIILGCFGITESYNFIISRFKKVDKRDI